MSNIIIDHNPSDEKLRHMDMFNWPVWTREACEFRWQYEENETCYILEGDVVVTPDKGEPVKVGKGDLVTFPKGMSCKWEIRKAVRKHYRFG